MKKGQRLWTREELILAINLYCKLPFGKLHRNNPDVVNLAGLINRTPNSVAFKLVNFASFDPSLRARGVRGAENASKLDMAIWDEFYNNWDILAFESEKLLAKHQNTTIEVINKIDLEEIREGKERNQLVKRRVNQNFFRATILASYNNACCITGIQYPELLIAGHIRPWGMDKANRMNPRNGVALSALHDKAFEQGLITILPNYRIKVSSVLKKKPSVAVTSFFLKYEDREILLPSRFLPDTKFLEYHNKERFKP